MNDAPRTVLECLRDFQEAAGDDYDLHSSFPSPADELLDECWKRWSEASSEDATVVHREVDLELATKLLAYSRRMAVLGLRTGSVKFVTHGLYAVSIDADRLDSRDVFRTVVLHVDVARRYGFDVEALFTAGLRLATPDRRAQLVAQFLRGPDFGRSLAAMKMRVAASDQGPTYVDELTSPIEGL